MVVETFRHRNRSSKIEAVHFVPSILEEAASWCGGKPIYNTSGMHELEVFNYEGPITAEPGDWIVKDERGKFYAIHEELFFSLYERSVSV
jgi:hypothetical protein